MYYDHDTIQQWIEDSRTNPPTISVPAALSRNVNGHGTHVASIAAGRKAGNFAGGVAPEARMLIVVAAADPNIPYSMSHLAALKFINECATKAKFPVVVNLSAGMNAGAHDGRSALEVAFDEFSGGGRTPGRIIVKSAGNERTNRGHAKVQLLPDAADTLKWESFTDPTWNRDRVELWWDSINTLRFRLTSPGNAQSDWVDMATPLVKGRLTGGGPFRMELLRRHPDNGDSRLMVELGGAAFTPLAAGTWTLEIEAVSIKTVADVHAWLEKGGTQPSVFVDHADPNMTLSVPGTAFSVITVGAVGSSKPLKMVDTSSFGPTRDQRSKPDVVAPGFEVLAAQGGSFDDVCPMTGTSMAAPHVTGTIALLLSRASKTGQTIPSASQVGAALRQNAQNATGSYSANMGFGVVNVEGFLTGF
jgi:endonuclease G